MYNYLKGYNIYIFNKNNEIKKDNKNNKVYRF